MKIYGIHPVVVTLIQTTGLRAGVFFCVEEKHKFTPNDGYNITTELVSTRLSSLIENPIQFLADGRTLVNSHG